MSFRTTTILFGVLLAVLWVFGLTLALRRSTSDKGLVLPSLADSDKGTINQVDIIKDGKTYAFTKKDDGWRLKYPGTNEEVRVEDSRVNELIEQVRSARHSNEETDVQLNRNLSAWDLESPKMIVVLRDTAVNQEYRFNVGSVSEDKTYVRVNSSERPREVLAVKKGSLSALFFTDINDFRVRRLIDATDTSTLSFDLKMPTSNKELELYKNEEGTWFFKVPKLGAADFEGTGRPKAKLKELKDFGKSKEDTDVAEGGVRGLLGAIIGLRAEEFEPPGGVALNEKTATLRIEIEYETGKPGKKGDRKKDVLWIGEKVAGQDRYFARLASDNSVVRVDAQRLKPLLDAVANPKLLRSHDLAQFNPENVDVIELFKGKEYAKLFLVEAGKKPKMPQDKFHPQQMPEEPEGSVWKVFSSDTQPRAGNEMAVKNLLTALQGKREVADKDFEDGNIKALEAKFAPEKITAKVMLYKDAIEEKKPDVKDLKAKKDEKKDDKTTKKDDKKEEKKDENTPPKLKPDVKPIVTLTFVQQSGDQFLVKREAPNTEPTYFTIGYNAFDKAVPQGLALAFLDTDIKPFVLSDAIKLTMTRNIDKERETFVLERDILKDKDEKKPADKDDKNKDDKNKQPSKDKKDDAKAKDKTADKKVEAPKYGADWKLIEPKDFAGKSEADNDAARRVLGILSQLRAVRWAVKATKENQELYGLDSPRITVKVEFKVGEGEKEPAKPFVLLIGNKSRVESDREGYFAMQQDGDLIFVVDPMVERILKDAEFRDRTVLKFEAAKVKELTVKVVVAKGTGQLSAMFERDPSKGWKLKGGVSRLDLDSRKVDEVLNKLSNLKVVRYLGAKMPPPADWRLNDDAKDIAQRPKVVISILMEDGKMHMLVVGALEHPQERDSLLYGWCNDVPNVVFLLDQTTFVPLTNLDYFALPKAQ